jgi:hypothetical protein
MDLISFLRNCCISVRTDKTPSPMYIKLNENLSFDVLSTINSAYFKTKNADHLATADYWGSN